MQPMGNPNIARFDGIEPPPAGRRNAAAIHAAGVETQGTTAWENNVVCGNVRVADAPSDDVMQPYGTPPDVVSKRVRAKIAEMRRQADEYESVLACFGPGRFTACLRPVQWLNDRSGSAGFATVIEREIKKATHVDVNGRLFRRDRQGRFLETAEADR